MDSFTGKVPSDTNHFHAWPALPALALSAKLLELPQTLQRLVGFLAFLGALFSPCDDEVLLLYGHGALCSVPFPCSQNVLEPVLPIIVTFL